MSDRSTGGPPPGWYAESPGAARLRWWDGAAWTQHYRFTTTDAAAPPPSDLPAITSADASEPPVGAAWATGRAQRRHRRRSHDELSDRDNDIAAFFAASTAGAAKAAVSTPEQAAPAPAAVVHAWPPPVSTLSGPIDTTAALGSMRRAADADDAAVLPTAPATSPSSTATSTSAESAVGEARSTVSAGPPESIVAAGQPRPASEAVEPEPSSEPPLLRRTRTGPRPTIEPSLARDAAPSAPDPSADAATADSVAAASAFDSDRPGEQFPDQIVVRPSVAADDDRMPRPLVYHPVSSSYVGELTRSLPEKSSRNGAATASLVLSALSLLGAVAVIGWLLAVNPMLAGTASLVNLGLALTAIFLAIGGLVIAAQRPTKKTTSIVALAVSALLTAGLGVVLFLVTVAITA